MGLFPFALILTSSLFVSTFYSVHGGIPTTIEGPFKPVTVPLDKSFRGKAEDLPETDPRVQKIGGRFQPEQISVSLSANYDSVWISWITGFCNFFSLINLNMAIRLLSL